MNKQIEGLRWRPRWVSHLGCVKGCLDHLGVDVSWDWLYGGTAHAFAINIHKSVCPSGPTAWNYEMLFRLGTNLGYKVSCVFSSRHDDPDFADKQTKAWIHVCNSLDDNIPCYGWELKMPEFYVIYGVDDEGYYYSGPGCDEGEGSKPWSEVGMSEIGILEIFSVERCEPVSDEKVVKNALAFAIQHAKSPRKRDIPDYRSGLRAFDQWAAALDEGMALRFGQGYNAAVWTECREAAVGFLKEAKERLPGRADALFDEAIGHYTIVYSKLKALLDSYPFEPASEDENKKLLKSPEGAALVREAAVAEMNGLKVLDRLFDSIQCQV